MENEAVFQPEQRRGILVHLLILLVLAVGTGLGFYQVAVAETGSGFVLYLLLTLVLLGLLPLVAYRLYALRNAFYIIEREGVQLRWGLRRVQIPMDEILWAHPAEEIHRTLHLPQIRWPGAVLGTRRQPKLGETEFLCSGTSKLVLIATPERIYAISPANPEAFLHSFERYIEMGSLSPLPAVSVYPMVLARRIWEDRTGRVLLFGGLWVGIVLLVWVSLLIPSRQLVYLGFLPDGSPGDQVPAPRLFLLPMVNSFFLVANTATGLFLFRREEGRAIAYLLWSMNILTSILFLAAVFWLLSAGD